MCNKSSIYHGEPEEEEEEPVLLANEPDRQPSKSLSPDESNHDGYITILSRQVGNCISPLISHHSARSWLTPLLFNFKQPDDPVEKASERTSSCWLCWNLRESPHNKWRQQQLPAVIQLNNNQSQGLRRLRSRFNSILCLSLTFCWEG